jgi:transcriptional regulator with XRE-family HTH domain
MFHSSWHQKLLGTEMCTERERRGLTTRQVGARLDWNPMRISRLERAESRPDVSDVHSIGAVYEVGSATLDRWTRLAQTGIADPWWERCRGLDPTYTELIAYEHDAARSESTQSTVLPGLLQTADYTRGLHAVSTLIIDHAHAEELIRVRGLRQERLTDARPLIVDATIDEVALSIPYGSAAVLRAQLGHLLDMAALPNITVRILPTAVAAERAPFTVLTLEDETGPAIVSVDVTFGEILDSDPDRVRIARAMLRSAQERALSPEDSMSLIETRLKD